MSIYKLGERVPMIAASAYVAPSAAVIGTVELGEHSSVWFGAVLRGDNDPIRIGANSNVQDGAVLHTDDGVPLTVGANVTIGHQATLHGCTVGDGSLIGIQAVVLNGAVIGKNCLVGAGAIVTAGKEFPDGSMIIGAPAKWVRPLRPEEIAGLQFNAAIYVKRTALFKDQLVVLD